tara:strand:- start:56 stop:259 length:204 start_codon:yes stop_codon:yes gene_type:complete
MFKAWLKGIGASIIIFIGIIFIINSIWELLKDNTSWGVVSLIIGAVLCIGGSYLKYISTQTVKTTKK